MTGTPLSSHRISLLHLIAIALFISAGCMLGLYVLLRRQFSLPPSQPQSGIVRVHLVQTPPPAAPAPETTLRVETAERAEPAHSPPAPQRAERKAEAVPVASRWEGGGTAAATALPAPPSALALQSPPNDTVADFQHRLLAHIEQYRRYPPAARGTHLHGKVTVLFIMNRDGTVRDVSVEDGSGAPVLDQEAVETIRRAQPLPSIPQPLADHLKIVLPVEFSGS